MPLAEREARHRRSYCASMYRGTVAAPTAPAEATKYDRDHKVGSRDRRCGNSSRRVRLVAPLTWFATNDGESGGLVLTNRCTWSGTTSPATTRHPCPAALASIRPRSRAATAPVSTGRRYFGHRTTCSPTSYAPPGETRTSRAILLVYQPLVSNGGRERGLARRLKTATPSARF